MKKKGPAGASRRRCPAPLDTTFKNLTIRTGVSVRIGVYYPEDRCKSVNKSTEVAGLAPAYQMRAYVASKQAVVGLGEGLAMELSGSRSISPSRCDTRRRERTWREKNRREAGLKGLASE